MFFKRVYAYICFQFLAVLTRDKDLKIFTTRTRADENFLAGVLGNIKLSTGKFYLNKFNRKIILSVFAANVWWHISPKFSFFRKNRN